MAQHSALARWIARQCLLSLDPDFRALDRETSAERIVELLVAWDRSGVADLYEFCADWIENQTMSRCRTAECDGDPNDGEGWDGFCGNCADRRDHLYHASIDDNVAEVVCPADGSPCGECEADDYENVGICS